MPRQGQFSSGSASQGAEFPEYSRSDNEALARRQTRTGFPSAPARFTSARTPARLVAPGAVTRRAMPASLPESAPALVLAVPDGRRGRPGRRDRGDRDRAPGGQPGPGRAHGADLPGRPAATRPGSARCWRTRRARRPAGSPSAVVIPQVVDAASGQLRRYGRPSRPAGPTRTSARCTTPTRCWAEALHHRLADAGLAGPTGCACSASRTSADGIILAHRGRGGGDRHRQRPPPSCSRRGSRSR